MHRVLISAPAERDMEQQHDWWAEHRSPEQAARWHAGFSRAIHELCLAPERCSLAPENGRWPFEVRQLTFGLGRRPTHRALFRVVGDQVIVLRTRHLAQGSLSVDDLAS